jgi:hypothetical protein
MAEYIEREALIAAIENDCPEMVNYSKREAIDCIKAEPAADVVEVKHGRWIWDEHPGEYLEEEYCSCPFCGKDSDWEHNFCPNCGADMREAGNE